MGIVFGCVVPHPPLMVPDVGGGQEKHIQATIDAMNLLADIFREKSPEVNIIISPHGKSQPEAMGVVISNPNPGYMKKWGAREKTVMFQNDPELAGLILKEAGEMGVPATPIASKEYEMDHGVMVPMHILGKATNAPLLPLTVSWESLKKHYDFGVAIQRSAVKSGKKVAVIASGDLSHRLLPSAPAGYDPMGKIFDREIADIITGWNSERLLKLSPELSERAGECGLRSIAILMGCMDGLSVKSEVLSYEGPFGVGYLVAAIEVLKSAATAKPRSSVSAKEMSPLVKLAKSTVESYIKEGRVIKPETLTPEMNEAAGVFVSLKIGGELRGCIGTFEPTCKNVAEEIVQNAVSSATHDPRFPAVKESELNSLEYSVDVLTCPEPVTGASKLDPRKYGIIVESGYRRGLLLPDLEGVDSVERQIEICRAKAGIAPDEPVKLYHFEVKRYK